MTSRPGGWARYLTAQEMASHDFGGRWSGCPELFMAARVKGSTTALFPTQRASPIRQWSFGQTAVQVSVFLLRLNAAEMEPLVGQTWFRSIS